MMKKNEIPNHLLRFFRPRYIYKPGDDAMIPHRIYQSLMSDGWYGRADIVWAKENAMPSSVKNRPTSAHEYIFLLAKQPDYYYDQAAIKEPLKHPQAQGMKFGGTKYPNGDSGADATYSGNVYDATKLTGKNKRSVWTINTQKYKGQHPATFPLKLAETCILAGCPPGGVVLDPFCGAATTGLAARKLGRRFIGIDLSANYCAEAVERLRKSA